jgi:Tol biopolymer transport system component
MKKWILVFCLWSSFGTADTIPEENRFLGNIRQMTFSGERSGEGYFSADGKQMVFQSEREPNNPFYQIYLLDVSSGKIQRVSNGVGKTTCSWIHPKESKVLFSSTHTDPQSAKLQKDEFEARKSPNQRRYSWDYDEHFDLYIKDLNSGTIKALAPAVGYDAEASFSPDGKWIAFSSNRHEYAGKKPSEYPKDPSQSLEIYIMKSDGTGLKRLTHADGYDGGPFFSADGKKIIWRRFAPDHHSSEVYSMNVDGSDQKQLTNDGKVSWAPYYHPTGDYFIYAISEGGRGQFDLYIKDSNGKSAAVRVTHFDGFDGLPVFSPDGKKLAWSSNRTSNKKSQIFIADWNDIEARKALNLVSAPNSSAMGRHVNFLASDDLDGRLTGTQGSKLAEDYVLESFKKAGLLVRVQDYTFTSGIVIGKKNELKISVDDKATSASLHQEWRPLSFSQNGTASTAEVVFAGYGIVAPAQESLSAYDSYVGIDVKGKWVMIFRYVPEDISPEYRVYLNRYSNLRYKAMLARERGAVGMIVVSGPSSQVKDQLIPLQSDGSFSETSLFAISITDDLAASVLKNADKKLIDVQKELDQGKAYSSFVIPNVKIVSEINLEREQSKSRNILGELKLSQSPKASWIVVGAHLDHLGKGQVSNSRAKGDEVGHVHRGADDNASGIAVLLELAAEFSKVKSSFKGAKRNILFAAWTGEEMGVLGSTYFVKNNKLKISAYLNMDMVGRMKEHLFVQGIGSSASWSEVIEKANSGLSTSLVIQSDPYLPTDSTPFYMNKVPILTLFTGAHDEYHTPRDVPSLINFEGMQKTKEFVAKLTRELVVYDRELDFTEVKGGSQDSSRKFRVYLGTIPDYAASDSKGVKISGTQKESPAELAGLKAGDVITEFAGKKIENIYDYTFILGALKPGEKVKLKVLRLGEHKELEIIPKAKE